MFQKDLSGKKCPFEAFPNYSTKRPSCPDATVGPFHSLTQGIRPLRKIQAVMKALGPTSRFQISGQHDFLVSDLPLLHGSHCLLSPFWWLLPKSCQSSWTWLLLGLWPLRSFLLDFMHCISAASIPMPHPAPSLSRAQCPGPWLVWEEALDRKSWEEETINLASSDLLGDQGQATYLSRLHFLFIYFSLRN